MSEENQTQDVVEDQEVTGATEEQQAEARQFGWVPQDEFKGKEEDWRDADEFLARGKEINGFLRKDLDKIKAIADSRTKEIEEMKATLKDFKDYHAKTEERAFKKALSELKKAKAEAIELQDGKTVVEIDESIEKLTDDFKQSQKTVQEETPKPSGTPEPSPAFIAWQTENPWFNSNPELRAVATMYGDQINAANPNLSDDEFLKQISEKVKQRFPEEFTNPNRSSSAVGSSGEHRKDSRGGKNKKSFDNLPPEAQVACKRFEAQGLITREQYLAEYDWD